MRLPGSALLLTTLMVLGCAAPLGDVARFQPQAGQELIQQGESGLLISRGSQSNVSIRPTTQPFIGSYPEYTVGIENLTAKELPLDMDKVRVTQVLDGQTVELRLRTPNEMFKEEAQKARNVVNVLKVLALVAEYDDDDPDGSVREQKIRAIEASQNEHLQLIGDLMLADHMLAPHEKYAGNILIEAPRPNKSGLKIYGISMTIGSDQHEILISESKPEK